MVSRKTLITAEKLGSSNSASGPYKTFVDNVLFLFLASYYWQFFVTFKKKLHIEKNGIFSFGFHTQKMGCWKCNALISQLLWGFSGVPTMLVSNIFHVIIVEYLSSNVNIPRWWCISWPKSCRNYMEGPYEFVIFEYIAWFNWILYLLIFISNFDIIHIILYYMSTCRTYIIHPSIFG